MKLVMTLLVRDEEDILDAHLRYHLDRGVDYVVATNNCSTDATRDILCSYEAGGHLKLIDEFRDDYSQAAWVTRMARLAATDLGADWVINSDADEFWWPQRNDLKSALSSLPARVRSCAVERHDFSPVLATTEGGPFYERMIYRKTQSVSVFGTRIGDKVAHRAHSRVRVMQGNHAVRPRWLMRWPHAAPIEILHFPMRTYPQFENKIRNGGRAYQRNRSEPRGSGGAWRHLFDLLERDGLRTYYDEQELDERSIGHALEHDVVVEDTRLRDYFKHAPPVAPVACERLDD